MHNFKVKDTYLQYTPGNVKRGDQSYANEILTRASGQELLAVHRMSTNL